MVGLLDLHNHVSLNVLFRVLVSRWSCCSRKPRPPGTYTQPMSQLGSHTPAGPPIPTGLQDGLPRSQLALFPALFALIELGWYCDYRTCGHYVT